MKIALVHCPFGHKIFSENLKVVDEEFCLAPPIILAYVASILEEAGHSVRLLDANVLGLAREDVLKNLSNFNPDIIGFRLDNYHFHSVVDWIDLLRSRLKVPVVVGGIAVTLYPYEIMNYSNIDYAVIGDAVEPLPLLLRTMENGGSLNAIKGIAFRLNGEIKVNFPSSSIVDFNRYPFPARHLLPNHLYYSFISQRKNFTIMITARGCLFNCSFCAIKRLPYHERAVASVIKEIEQCYFDFKIREIDFFDATFFLNKPRAMTLFREIKKRKLKIEWSCRSRVDTVDNELLREAVESGCRQIYYGIESASPVTLKRVNKQINLESIKKAICISRNYGIRTMGFFMVGNPGDTTESVKDTISFSKDLGLDFIQVCRTIAKPNTDLNDMIMEKTGRDFWKEYIIDRRLENSRLPTPWTSLTEEEIESCTKKAYYEFYFRPLHILKILMKAKSFKEIMRYFRVACRMLNILKSN